MGQRFLLKNIEACTGQRAIIQRIQNEAPHMVEQIMTDIKSNITRVFDLKDLVTSALVRDKELLNRVFLEAGHVEFKFIRNSGIYFGFAIGIVQAIVWAMTHNIWVIPLFGLFTGFALIGRKIIDRRKKRQLGEGWPRLAATTRKVHITRNGLLRTLMAVLLYGALISLHAPVIGVSPLP